MVIVKKMIYNLRGIYIENIVLFINFKGNIAFFIVGWIYLLAA
jgi:hypothetical protein